MKPLVILRREEGEEKDDQDTEAKGEKRRRWSSVGSEEADYANRRRHDAKTGKRWRRW